MPVLTAHYGESPYKTCLYGDFLNLYGGGQGNSILTTGITHVQHTTKFSTAVHYTLDQHISSQIAKITRPTRVPWWTDKTCRKF